MALVSLQCGLAYLRSLGTEIAAICQAHDAGLDVHVWVGKTRTRNRGAFLTAWELERHGVPHTVIADNACGHLMQHGEVDLCIVDTDRTTVTGDVCDMIGTYLKALAAHDNGVPFNVALPSSTIDATLGDCVRAVTIEERAAAEVTHISGQVVDGEVVEVQLTPYGSPATNLAFDVISVRVVSGLVTKRGMVEASPTGLVKTVTDLF